MTRHRSIPSMINGAAPWATLVVVVALSVWLPNRVELDGQSAQRRMEIAAAMAAVPYIIGEWYGQVRDADQDGVDDDIPREAQELLRPNAILSRRYLSPGRMSLHLLVVHCSDARDMLGHYPPECYPSAGWLRLLPLAEPEAIELAVGELRVPMRTYQFKRIGEQGTEETIRIFNAFALPNGVVTRDIGDINRQSERLAVSVQGVAQMQIMTNAAVEQDEAIAAAGEVLAGMPNLLEALCVVQGASHESS